jgi:Aerotolerance regulator N-terminal
MMLPLLTYPLALIGLAGVPLLVGIYLLRVRFRRQPVSSLMLWVDPREARDGGPRIRRFQAPLLFLLELLAILLLVLAAAEPQIRVASNLRPLVVVLDDSFSMLAGGDDSPRRQGIVAITDLLHQRSGGSVRFVLAGERPVALGEPVHSVAEVETLLEGWRCRAPTARIDDALALAADLGGDVAVLLVVTDHAPADGVVPPKGRLRWWSLGKSRPNLALVTAARSDREGAGRCILEIANLSHEPGTTNLTVDAGGAAVHTSHLNLVPNEVRRVVLNLPADTPTLHARLDNDALTIDNEAYLPPNSAQQNVRVAIRIGTKELRDPLLKAIRSVQGTEITNVRPDLVFTEDEPEMETVDTWTIRFVAHKEAEAFTGPFVLDRTHPLTEGLSLRGVIWAAGKADTLEGTPVIMAGNVVLLTDTETRTDGPFARHTLRCALRPDLSTLQDSPDWPILIQNLLNWRASQTLGPNRASIRLGETVTVTFPDVPKGSVHLTTPQKEKRELPTRGRTVAVRPEEVGVYGVSGGDSSYTFAVNALNRDESDLTKCTSGRWGDWLDDTSVRMEFRSMVPAVLLLLLGVLTLHLLLASGAANTKKH